MSTELWPPFGSDSFYGIGLLLSMHFQIGVRDRVFSSEPEKKKKIEAYWQEKLMVNGASKRDQNITIKGGREKINNYCQK